jgi:hypothetical protein
MRQVVVSCEMQGLKNGKQHLEPLLGQKERQTFQFLAFLTVNLKGIIR